MRLVPCLLTSAFTVLGVLTYNVLLAQQEPKNSGDSPQVSQVRVTISKETTWVTGPLRADGYVDYVAALNELTSRDVTPENNAAVLLIEALGPAGLHESIRAEFIKRLGIDSLPEDGQYLVSSDQFENELAADGPDTDIREQFSKNYSTAMKRPWTPDEFPLVARWLKVNEPFIPKIIEATKRPRYYAPLLGAKGKDASVIAVLLPCLQQSRHVARLLTAQAMLRLGEKRNDEAWDALLACHRLSRLCGQDPTLVGALVAIAIDGIAISGDTQLIQHGHLTAAQYKKMLDQLQQIAPLPKMAEKIDTADRYMFLDVVCSLARGGSADLFGGLREDSRFVQFVKSATLPLMDWDMVLRDGNSWYDRIVANMQLPSHAERQRAAKALEQDLQALVKKIKDPLWMAMGLFRPKKAASEGMSSVLISLLCPAVSAARTAEDRSDAQFTLVQIGFALAAYHADHQSYPESLRDLTPDYIAELPTDIFTGDDLLYGTTDAGFLLYCRGPNMKNNQGKVNYLDRALAEPGEDTSDWDDYRLKIPVSVE